MEDPHALPLLVIEFGFQKELRYAEDSVHRGADLVAHGSQEFAFCSGRFLRYLFRLNEIGRLLGEFDGLCLQLVVRGLDLLVASRYHASVLSLAGHVPQVAVGHDQRLRTLYAELGLLDGYFVESHAPDLFGRLGQRVERLLDDAGAQREILRRGHEGLLARARRNDAILRSFARNCGWLQAPATRFELQVSPTGGVL